MVAQAKALQAFAYSVLLPHYGGLPIINGNLTEVNSSNGKRATFEATVDSIVKWCDEANEDLLYWAYNGNDAESSQLQTGRWTKAGVMALKAQVLWLAASLCSTAVKATMEERRRLRPTIWYGMAIFNRVAGSVQSKLLKISGKRTNATVDITILSKPPRKIAMDTA